MLIYTDLVRQIIEDVSRRVRDFRHLDPERIGLLAAARSSGGYPRGNLATCYGLRTNDTPTFSIWVNPRTRQIIAVSRWFQYRCPRVRFSGREMSYLILLRLPRLLMRNPLQTIVHELYHIGEDFDGRMRPERHGRLFDREVRRLTEAWLHAHRGDLAHLSQMRLHELQREFGAVLAEGTPPRFSVPVLETVDAPETYARAAARLYPNYRLAPHFEIRPAPVSGEDVPRVITERDLVLRHYSRNGSERLPATFARYSRRNLALSA